MVNGGHLHAAPAEPLAVFGGDFEILLDDGLGCNAAETDNDFGLDQCNLVAKITDAGILLRFQRIPVLGRTALDDVGNIAVAVAAQINDPKHIVQQLSRRTHKGYALNVLLFAGAFAYEHDLGVGLADVAVDVQAAAHAGLVGLVGGIICLIAICLVP